MKTISVFNHVTIDGYFAGPKGEIDWFKFIKPDPEWNAYTHKQSQSGNSTLVFGHTTYTMMKSWWPTEMAMQADPAMAKVVNHNRKMVFSKTLKKAEEEPNWKNIRLFNDIKPKEILKLKEKENMMLMGSGSIIQQFANYNLIDEYSLVIVPIILGKGRPLFKDVKMTSLELLEARNFKNGITLLRYKPTN